MTGEDQAEQLIPSADLWSLLVEPVVEDEAAEDVNEPAAIVNDPADSQWLFNDAQVPVVINLIALRLGNKNWARYLTTESSKTTKSQQSPSPQPKERRSERPNASSIRFKSDGRPP